MIKILKYRKMNKKGIFFTILAIALLSLFAVSYSVYSFVQSREGIDKRIKTMNSYVSSLEEDIPRKLYISGYRIIFLMEEKIIEDGQYLKDIDANFSGAFFNGTLYGVNHNATNEGILYGTTFSDIVRDINRNANQLNIDVNFVEPEVSISQDDPWHVKVSLKSNLIIKDKGNLANWSRTSAIYTYIPIKNFEDPVYIVNTGARVVNKFEQTIYSPVSGNLLLHAENSYYTNHTDAPSFLQRLEGNLTADSNRNGIESLINTHNLSSQGWQVKPKCIIDYIYFNDTNNPATHTPDLSNPWIVIDNSEEHTSLYG
jgi:hypothetical protein